MYNPEFKTTERKQMTVSNIEGIDALSEKQLLTEGWQEAYSFHHNNPEQWNMACDEARAITASGLWNVIFVNPDDERQRRDGVQLLFKRLKRKD